MNRETFKDHLYTSLLCLNPNQLPAIPHYCAYEFLHKRIECDFDGSAKHFPRVVCLYSISGCGHLEYHGKTYRVQPGKLLLLPLPDHLRFHIHPEAESWETLTVSFNDDFSIRLCKSLKDEVGFLLPLEPNSKIPSAMQTLYEAIKDSQRNQASGISLAGYSFLIQMLREFGEHAVQNVEKQSLRTQAETYCMRHLEERIPVEDLAHFCGFTRAYFSRIFTCENGISPSEFILEFKLKIAETLLRNERGISVKEVAAKCGFEDHSHFCRVFKKRYHISPAQYAMHVRNALPTLKTLCLPSQNHARKNTT